MAVYLCLVAYTFQQKGSLCLEAQPAVGVGVECHPPHMKATSLYTVVEIEWSAKMVLVITN